MSEVPFTSEQRQAIEAVDRAVVVAAAAGSGKTAVLAERCAYLVCDAPPEYRCDADQLLVLTFTDAAAAEMRGRTIEAIRRRLVARPHDHRLREQLLRAEAAQISTIHAFCRWMIRRWFVEADVDANASVLDADEATLIQQECVDAYLSRLYEQAEGGVPIVPLSIDPPPAPASPSVEVELAREFTSLVERYGLGVDDSIRSLILRLHQFTQSLPEPEEWLRQARDCSPARQAAVLRGRLNAMAAEVALQADHVRATIDAVADADVQQLCRLYANALADWGDALRLASGGTANRGERTLSLHEICRTIDDVGGLIRAFQIPSLQRSRCSETRDEVSKAAMDRVRKNLRDRLKGSVAAFSSDELIEAMKSTVPYCGTICRLVAEFGEAYGRRKRELGVVDFSDLERFAYRLLGAGGDRQRDDDVSAILQRRFAHVLVDEFQDVNPLQERIIQRVCRSRADGSPCNLFVVGDVKQCIYRFRLAEPELLLSRVDRLRTADAKDALIALQANFRSLPPVIDAVNHVFSTLDASGVHGVPYDDIARLRATRPLSPGEHRPIELHVIETSASDDDAAAADDDDAEDESTDGADEGDRPVAGDDPARWSDHEREAYVIARRIREWREESARSNTPAPKYGDMAVLLRSERARADRMASMLRRLGVPARADAGDSLFDAREVRDVIAALTLLDNTRQDIPLAAVMRSGIFGETFSADDLLRIRLADRSGAYHENARRLASDETAGDLGFRLGQLFTRVDRTRERMRRSPLPDALWSLYHDHGFLAYVGGLPGGMRRRMNLIKLHQLARRFAHFRRQGLYRFLRVVEGLADEHHRITTAPEIAGDDDVVRIMTIHRSKGLQFPIVFLAGLGAKFNLGDRKGRMIFERHAGLGLKVIDPVRMIEYPSPQHANAIDELTRATREDELRILYVAMTRAEDRLVLVGSVGPRSPARGMLGAGSQVTSTMSLVEAMSHLNWLLHAAQQGSAGDSAVSADRHPIHLVRHGPDDMAKWEVPESRAGSPPAEVLAFARCEELPQGTPAAEGPEIRGVLDRIRYVYPHLSLSNVPAVQAAGTFKGTWDFQSDPDTLTDASADDPRSRRGGFATPVTSTEGHCSKSSGTPSATPLGEDLFPKGSGTLDSAILGADTPAGTFDTEGRCSRSGGTPCPAPFGANQGSEGSGTIAGRGSFERGALNPGDPDGRSAAMIRGTATHRALQHLEFAGVESAADVVRELQRLVSAGLLTGEELAQVDEPGIAWFAGTPLAAAIRGAGRSYRREVEFITREPASVPGTEVTGDDFVLIRGVVDGILPSGEAMEVVDFKTDRVRADVDQYAERYAGQMATYARAVSRLFKRPAGACHLVFLSARAIVTFLPDVARESD